MDFKKALKQANAAFVEDLYEEALDLYNTAILLKNNSDAYAKRAQCHIKLKKYKEAVIDANTAIQIDGHNARGHLRRGVGLFYLRDINEAQKAFEAGLSVATKDRETFDVWIKRCKAAHAAEPKPPAPKQPAAAPAKPATAPTPTAVPTPAPSKQPASEPTQAPAKPIAQPPVTAPTPSGPPKIRHEWYQNESHVVVTVFAKNARDKAAIDIQEQNLTVSIKLSEDNTFELDIDLCRKVDPSKSSYEITPSKVEIKLKKADPVRWATLESAEELPPPAATTTKNWDKIMKDEVVEDAPSEMGFLRDLYAGAGEEEKRAMLKSMEQSGGTVLNMNWGDVEKKVIKPKPSEWSRNKPEPGDDSDDSDSDEAWNRRAQERANEYHSKRRQKKRASDDDDDD